MPDLPYHHVLAAITDGLVLLDAADRVTWANSAALKILRQGQPAGPRTSWTMPHPVALDGRALMHSEYPWVICRHAGTALQRLEFALPHPDGGLAARVGRCIPGKRTGEVLVLLREPGEPAAPAAGSTELFRSAIEHADDMVMITDPQGAIQYVNPAFAKVTGYEQAEVLGRTPELLRSGKHSRRFYQQIQRTLDQGRIWKGNITHRRKGGELCEQEVTIGPMFDPDGRPTRFVWMMRDITERRELEAQLAQAQKLETVGTLAGNIAHDFNNLLTIIGCNVATILESLPAGHAAHRLLLDVQRASEQAAELTRDLLTFSRKTKPRLTSCELSAVASEAVRLMRHTLPPDVELRTEFCGETLLTKGDPTQLHQVIVNLCLNARDAMPQGGVLTLRTWCRFIDDARHAGHPEMRVGEYVVLSVQDTGCGMPPEVQARVFEPFFTTKAPGRGTGLGLSIVHGIVKAHHGWLEIVSAPDEGTRVDVCLPSSATLIDEPSPEPAGPHHGTGTVLLVDDEPMILALLRTVLESRGYQTIAAQDSEQAIALFRERHASLAAVVLDRNLRKVSGASVLAGLRAIDPEAPVVVISGSTPSPDEQPIYNDAFTYFLPKPFKPVEVLTALQTLRSARGIRSLFEPKGD